MKYPGKVSKVDNLLLVSFTWYFIREFSFMDLCWTKKKILSRIDYSRFLFYIVSYNYLLFHDQQFYWKSSSKWNKEIFPEVRNENLFTCCHFAMLLAATTKKERRDRMEADEINKTRRFCLPAAAFRPVSTFHITYRNRLSHESRPIKKIRLRLVTSGYWPAGTANRYKGHRPSESTIN